MSVYKGNKLVAGGSIDTHFVRKPDWANVVEVTVEQLYAGYTAPSDGMFICAGVMPTLGGGGDAISRVITINGIPIASGQYISNNVFSFDSNNCLVNKGDLIKSNIDNAWDPERRYFVPFEDSTVSESDVEVVTPELIRNLHDPDWSKIQYYTAAQLNAGITIPARGIFICTVHTGSSQQSLSNLKINGKTVDWSYWNVADGIFDLTKFCFSGPVCKGDIVTVTFNVFTGHDNDYTNFPIAFVPYKAQ